MTRMVLLGSILCGETGGVAALRDLRFAAGCPLARKEAVGVVLQKNAPCRDSRYQDPPSTLNWGYMVPNRGYLGPNRG